MNGRSRGVGVAFLAVAVAGVLVFQSTGAVVAQTSASLTVHAEDASADRVADALVILYDADWNELGQRRTDANGRVRWEGLPAGTYHLELYGPRDAFWGGREVRLESGDDETVTVSRTEPHVSGVTVVDGSGDGVYRPGESIVVSADVRNGQEFPRRVRVSFAVDADGDETADASTTRTPREIGERSTVAFEYRLTPERPGTYRLRIRVETEVGDRWVTTEAPTWSNRVSVSPTATPTRTATATPTTAATAPPAGSADRTLSPLLLFVLVCGLAVGLVVGYTRIAR